MNALSLQGCRTSEEAVIDAERPQAAIPAAVDVSGWNPDLGEDSWLGPDGDRRLRPLGIDLSTRRNELYWAEYDGDRVRRLGLDDASIADVVTGVDGPISVAVDDVRQQLYWTADASYPRKVQRVSLETGVVETLLEGPLVNRPRAIAVDSEAGSLFWSESVSGRVRRSKLDGSVVTDLVTSGYGIHDREDSAELKILGMAVARNPPSLYWTDAARDVIVRASHEVSAVDTLVASQPAVELPAGLVVHPTEDVLYWADVAGGAIWRAGRDGSDASRLVGDDDGLLEPYGVALDPTRGKLYWTDAAIDRIGRCDLDGSHVEFLVLDDEGHDRGAWRPYEPLVRGAVCGEDARRARTAIRLHAEKLVVTCLLEVDTLVAVRRAASEVIGATDVCIEQLARLDAGTTDGVAAELRRLTADCGVEDVADELDATMKDVSLRVQRRFVRAQEWLEDVRPFVEERARADDGASLALRALDGLREHMQAARTVRTRVAGYVGSGQITSYRATRAGDDRWVPVADDGYLRAGGRLRFRDNLDGTISDLSTGLMWEKKCSGCGGLHDYRTEYRWTGKGEEETVWDWLAEINREGGDGFGGYSDWRLPNVKELHSLLAYEQFNPAVKDDFNRPACNRDCVDVADPRCSCVENGEYWSSTTSAGSADEALAVGFNLGLIGDMNKVEDLPARAVRGGLVPGTEASAQ